MHAHPQVLWVGSPDEHTSPQPNEYIFRVQDLSGKVAGFVVSSCAPQKYVEVRALKDGTPGKIPPEGEAEIVVVPGKVGEKCDHWLQPQQWPDRADGENLYELRIDGETLRAVVVPQMLTTFPVVKLLACREGRGRPFLFRLTVSGMFADFAARRADLVRVLRSFRVEE